MANSNLEHHHHENIKRPPVIKIHFLSGPMLIDIAAQIGDNRKIVDAKFKIFWPPSPAAASPASVKGKYLD